MAEIVPNNGITIAIPCKYLKHVFQEYLFINYQPDYSQKSGKTSEKIQRYKTAKHLIISVSQFIRRYMKTKNKRWKNQKSSNAAADVFCQYFEQLSRRLHYNETYVNILWKILLEANKKVQEIVYQ